MSSPQAKPGQLVRKNVPTDATGTPLKTTDITGPVLQVDVVSSVGGAGGTSMADDAAFTPGTTQITPAGGTYRTVRDNLDDNDAGTIAITQKRAVLTSIEDSAGDSCMDDANNALRVNIVAGAGSGGTAMTDDAAFTPGTTSITPVGGTYRSVRDLVDDNDAGALAMTQRRALLSSIETPNGDTAMDDTNDAVRVNIVAGSASGVSHIDDAAFTPATDDGVPIFGVFDDTTPDSVDEGDAGAVRMSANRNLYIRIRDNAGNERGANVDASNRLSVAVDNNPVLGAGTNNIGDVDVLTLPALPSGTNNIGDVDIASLPNEGQQTMVNSISVAVASDQSAVPVSGTVIANAGSGTFTTSDTASLVDDAAFTPATSRVLMAGFEFDDITPDSVNEGDAGAARMSANRNVYTQIRDAAGNERGANVNASNQLSVSVDNNPVLGAGNNNIGDVDIASIAAGDNNIGNVDVVTLPSLPAGTNNIGDIDVLSVIPGTGATNLGKAEDAAHTDGDVGVMALGVRRDADTTPVSADGDYHALLFDNAGNLKVNIKAGSSGGPSKVDDAAFSVATDSVAPMGALADETTPDSVDEGDIGIPRMTLNRKLYSVIADPSAERSATVRDTGTNDSLNVAIVDAAGNQITSFGGSGGTSHGDDAAFTIGGASSITPAGFLADETTPDSVDEGDVGVPRMTLDRKILTRIVGASDANRLDIDGSGHAQIDIAAASVTVPVDTELPAAAALGDTDANPTTPLIGASGMVWNGTTWTRTKGSSGDGASASGMQNILAMMFNGTTHDRMRGTTANGLDVDVTRPSANVPASSALGALNNAVTLNGEGTGVLNWEIDTGTLVGTVVFEATLDDTNWFAINAMRIDGTIISSITSFSDRGVLTSSGYSQVRLRVSAYTSGTSNGRLESSAGTSVVRLGQAIPTGNNNIGDVDVASIAAGDNNIGNVDVLTLPALPSGTNNIGDVDVLTLPAIPAGTNNIGDVDIASFAAGAITEVQGDVAHDAANAGNPVKIGGRARTSDITAVASDDVTDFLSDTLGKQVQLPYSIPENFTSGITASITGTTDTAVIAAPGAGIRLYITHILVTNGHATVSTYVNIKDGTTSIYTGYAAAAGGGFSVTLPVPLRLTANTALNAANVTTGSDTRVSASGYKAV